MQSGGIMEFHPQNVRKLPFFRDLPDSLTEKLFQNGRLVRYRKGATVFSSGELLSCAYLLLDGEAMIYNLTRRGKSSLFWAAAICSTTIWPRPGGQPFSAKPLRLC